MFSTICISSCSESKRAANDSFFSSAFSSFVLASRASAGSAARNSNNDAQGKELVQWPAKTYPTGVISLTHDFRQPGYFVGVVTLEDMKSGEKHVLRLPFRVAKAAETNWLAILLVAVVLAAGGYYYFMVYRKRPAAAPA